METTDLQPDQSSSYQQPPPRQPPDGPPDGPTLSDWYRSKTRGKRIGIVVGVVIVVILALSALTTPTDTDPTGSKAPAPAPTVRITEQVTVPAPAPAPAAAPQPPPAPKGPATSFSDGVHKVGEDIAAGSYKTDGDGGIMGCYWARLKNDSGEFDAIIANQIVQGPSRVTVKTGEYLETSGGCNYTKAA
ncbi:MAG: hypothetical protein M3O70_12480 [Actinomycetota bacterium]|nr:hypothetical protein [Actinomycetota bacterium]